MKCLLTRVQCVFYMFQCSSLYVFCARESYQCATTCCKLKQNISSRIIKHVGGSHSSQCRVHVDSTKERVLAPAVFGKIRRFGQCDAKLCLQGLVQQRLRLLIRHRFQNPALITRGIGENDGMPVRLRKIENALSRVLLETYS